jgi:hypothetical protein
MARPDRADRLGRADRPANLILLFPLVLGHHFSEVAGVWPR